VASFTHRSDCSLLTEPRTEDTHVVVREDEVLAVQAQRTEPEPSQPPIVRETRRTVDESDGRLETPRRSPDPGDRVAAHAVPRPPAAEARRRWPVHRGPRRNMRDAHLRSLHQIGT